ncbi:MAG: MerR family transcriptional regulator [Candidatus Babeliales bacterium]|nr:MerR family transcriptional regulator [Candidatus Babeliales bacterium]
MVKVQRKKGYFSISAVAKMFTIHQQTIRLYEKEGLITPKRSEGNTRLFSEEDISRLEEIVHLNNQLGINLAGVEMIFKLKRQINRMQKEMNRVFDTAQEDLDNQAEASKQTIKTSAQQLQKITRSADDSASSPKRINMALDKNSSTQELAQEDVDTWKIDYDE